ncbi:MAG: hypothetical protein KA523_07380 [Flavobacterium sp.]|nr:hypothetical protein [Flavobacterium sp.]
MKNIIEQKVRNGYSLDLGKLIDESFATFKKTFLIAGLGMIIISVVMIVFYLGILGAFFGFSNFTETMTSLESLATDTTFIIGNAVVTMLFSALFAPITAGFININHLAKTNKEFGVSDLFNFYKGAIFKQIFMSYLVIGFTTAVITASFSLLGYEFMNSIIQIIIGLFTVFTIQLIIYGEQNYTEAITNSIQLFIKKPFIIAIALLIAGIGMFLGIFALCIGIIFTVPYLYSMYYAIYAQSVGFQNTSPIDEIGIE